MTKTIIKTTTYNLENGIFLDIQEFPEEYKAYIYHEDSKVKKLIATSGGKAKGERYFTEMVESTMIDEALDMAIKALKQQPLLDKIRAEIEDTLYVDSQIFGELIDFKNGKISADDVIEEFNRVTRLEVLQIIDKYKEVEI